MTVQMTNAQLQDLIVGCIAGAGGGAAGAAGTMSAASMLGPMGPCTLGKDKLKRPKKWADWHHEVENKMRFGGITDGGRKLDFLRSCTGAELTELWDKEVRGSTRQQCRGLRGRRPTPTQRWWRTPRRPCTSW